VKARLRWPRITARPQREDGALFVRGNPVASPPLGPSVVAAPAAKPGALIRVLLADHNPSSIELARGALARSGVRHHLQIAGDCRAVLDLLFAGCDAPTFLPDLILLALDLPGGDTIEIYRSIRASAWLAQIPVILLATSTREEDIRRKYRVTDNTYVRRPADLSKTIEVLGDHWDVFALFPPVA